MEEVRLSEASRGELSESIKGAMAAALAANSKVEEVKLPPAPVSQDPKAERDEKIKAEMRQGYTAVIEDPLNRILPGVNLGSIAIGGFAGLALGELTDAFVAPTDAAGKLNILNPAVKVGEMMALKQFGGRLISRDAVNAALVVLAVQALTDILPLERWIGSMVDWIKGKKTVASSGSGKSPGAFNQGLPSSPEADLLAGVLG